MSTALINILAVSLAINGEKAMVYGMYNQETLHIIASVPLYGGYGEWKGRVVEEVKKRTAEGWVVLVDEGLTDLISRYATAFRGEDLFRPGITFIHAAITAYHDLSKKGLVTFEGKVQKYQVSASLIETVPDDKGRPRYDINIDSVKAGHLGVLLCAFASIYSLWGEERYVEALYKSLVEADEDNPLNRIRRVLDKSEDIRGGFL